MTVYRGSRYQNSTVVSVDVDGVGRPTVLRANAAPAPGTRSIVADDATNLQQLAAVYLGNAELWWQIADLNPTVLYPDSIAPGTTLVIP
jgi:hypothetical protein